MNLENSIKDVIKQKLEDGTIESIISTQLEKGVNEASVDSILPSAEPEPDITFS